LQELISNDLLFPFEMHIPTVIGSAWRPHSKIPICITQLEGWASAREVWGKHATQWLQELISNDLLFPFEMHIPTVIGSA